jgi:hypothetical protein
MALKKKSTARRRPGPRAKALEDTASTESIVIYVHGIGKHPAKAELKLQWDLALFGRDLGDRSRMARWSDLVHLEGSRASKKVLRPNATNDLDRADTGMLDVDELLRSAGISAEKDEAQEFSLSLLRQLGVQEAGAAGSIGKKILPLPAWMRKPISRAFIEALISDTAAYFFKPNLRRQIRQRLLDELPTSPSQPVTIVAHSQGSVIAHEVLSGLTERQINLDALVTIGSPLGIREVQDFLEPDTLAVPSVVKRWHNFADPLDPVAMDKGLASDFRSPEAVVQDELILNNQSRRLWGFNPHSAVGYLAHPRVRRVVNDAMRMDVLARFVIARDVAERLGAAAEERHAVLIEVLEPGYGALDESAEAMHEQEKKERAVLRRAADQGLASLSLPLSLEHRVQNAAQALRGIVRDEQAARIDALRRFVAAHLTANELLEVGAKHKALRVYAVWQSSRKAKLTNRSMRVLKADAALSSFSADGQGITWAVLDTGIRADHPHFKGIVKAVWDCTQRGRPVKVADAHDADGHGTHVAGIIAGKAPEGLERGVAPRANLVVYKVLNDKGQGEDAWIIKALDHIAEQNDNVAEGLAIHGLNLSLGGPFDNTVYGCGFSPICAELRRLWRGGVLVVVACGNEGQLQVQTPDGDTEINTAMSIGDPANLEDCIAVGSVNADRPHLYGVSSFSSRGPTADGRGKPDVVAPGERIRSCNARFRGSDDWYYAESGTSMAAPHVSGLLAAFLSARREFRGRPDEVKQILLKSCVDIGRDRYHQGAGIPNLMQMLLAV